MKFQKVKIRQMAWYGDEEIELRFPKNWIVETCHMRGHNAKKLGKQEIEKSFKNPIKSSKISSLAKGKGEVAIIFDDITRPTKIEEIIPCVLEELRIAGIPENSVRFIAALGAHGAHSLEDFRKKLGEKVLDRFPVYNHNCYENCIKIGETSFGTPVILNKEVMSCDLKIGIGCIVPHISAGFGGGGKIILPGIASIDSIEANHRLAGRGAPVDGFLLGKPHPSVGLGKFTDNIMYKDIVEASKLARLDIKIDVVINGRREIIGLFVGDPKEEHARGIQMAKDVYLTKNRMDVDIVVVNAYSKVMEAILAVDFGIQALSERGGDIVLIVHTPAGQITHYTRRSFGKKIGGRFWGPRTLPGKVKRIWVYSPYTDKAGADWFGPEDLIIFAKTWDEVLEKLIPSHIATPKVAVYPDATIQYFGS